MSAEDEKKAAAGAPAVVRSDGADAAQGYAETEVPEGSRTPTVEMFRVQVTDPRRAPTMRRDDMLKGSGPRAPEQTAPPVARAPGVEAPMGRPATKMQPLRFDQEFLEELRQKRAQAANDEVPESEALAEAPPRGEETARATEEEDGAPRPASPWVKDAAAAPAETLDLPSSHAPPAMPEAVSPPAVSSPAVGAGHGKGLALAGVVIGVAMFLALRAAVTRPGGALPPAPVSTTATPSTAPSATSGATETASTAPSATETTSTGVAAPEASTAAPVSTGHPPSPSKPPGALENPYDAAVVTPIPAATVAPTAPPTVAPIAPPTVAPIAPPPPSTAPKAPPTASSARPSPISTSGRIVGGEE